MLAVVCVPCTVLLMSSFKCDLFIHCLFSADPWKNNCNKRELNSHSFGPVLILFYSPWSKEKRNTHQERMYEGEGAL